MPDAAPATPAAPAAPAPPSNGATPANPNAGTPPAEAPFIELVVDGQKQKFTEAEARRLLSKSAFADKSIRQAKDALKKIKDAEAQRASELESAKKDEAAFLRAHGIDPEAFARKVLDAKVREGQMTPEQREIAGLKADREADQKKLDEFQKEKTQKQQAVIEGQLQKRIEGELSAAAEKAGIAPDSESFYAIYEALKEWVDLDLPWDPERIIEVAQERINGTQSALESAVLKGLKGDALLTRLGPSVVKEVLLARVAQIQGKPFNKAAPPSTSPPPPTTTSQYITPGEADARFRALARKR